jgi:hypothetical protein
LRDSDSTEDNRRCSQNGRGIEDRVEGQYKEGIKDNGQANQDRKGIWGDNENMR